MRGIDLYNVEPEFLEEKWLILHRLGSDMWDNGGFNWRENWGKPRSVHFHWNKTQSNILTTFNSNTYKNP